MAHAISRPRVAKKKAVVIKILRDNYRLVETIIITVVISVCIYVLLLVDVVFHSRLPICFSSNLKV